MSARTPRRSFLAPFVITLGACGSSAPPLSTPPTAPGGDGTTADTPTPGHYVPADPGAGTAPGPDPAAAKQLGDREWTLIRQGDHCVTIDTRACPQPAPGAPIAPCSPPPPVDYVCPAELTADNTVTIRHARGANYCELIAPMPVCPPHVMCNPPRPRSIQCPQ